MWTGLALRALLSTSHAWSEATGEVSGLAFMPSVSFVFEFGDRFLTALENEYLATG